MAAQTHREAYVPVTLALANLWLHQVMAERFPAWALRKWPFGEGWNWPRSLAFSRQGRGAGGALQLLRAIVAAVFPAVAPAPGAAGAPQSAVADLGRGRDSGGGAGTGGAGGAGSAADAGISFESAKQAWNVFVVWALVSVDNMSVVSLAVFLVIVVHFRLRLQGQRRYLREARIQQQAERAARRRAAPANDEGLHNEPIRAYPLLP